MNEWMIGHFKQSLLLPLSDIANSQLTSNFVFLYLVKGVAMEIHIMYSEESHTAIDTG